MDKQRTILKWTQRVWLLLLLMNIAACDNLSDVGNQSDAPPRANVIVQGMKATDSTSNTFVVRGGTDVLLTGKDSDGVDDPILTFKWLQTDSSGYKVALIERSTNSRVFVAPIVAENTELRFLLTVVDADGKTSSHAVTVTVTPVGDVNHFLTHPDSNEASLRLLVAPDAGQITGNAEELFEINIEVVAHWRNREGSYDSITVSSDVLNASFPANYAAPTDPTAATNPRLMFNLPSLNIDLINQYFEAEDRQRRLEFYHIDSAYLDLKLTLDPKNTTVSFKAYAFDGSDLLLANEITSASISGDATLRSLSSPLVQALSVAEKPSQAVLLDTASGTFDVSVLVEELKAQVGVDNVQTGRNYYALIDPTDEFVYLNDWLVYAGFTDKYGKAISDESIAHAIYLNNYDLGFGRNMWTRYDETTGNVYSYVINYPSLEASVKGVGDFAVVVMEYSGYPSSADQKIVKFYAYVPDDRNGGYIRANTMNFDGRGEKAVPGVCASCHYQDKSTVGSDFTQVADADIGATFLPWDLDSFLYSDSSNEGEVDPSYNATNISSNVRFDASRLGQEAELKKMNQHALTTYINDTERHDGSIKLLHCMYGDQAPIGDVSKLPEGEFDSKCVQEGWQEQEALYHSVYARNCRACHTQFPESVEDTAINFDTYADFVSTSKLPLLKNYVFQQGRMPLARLTMDRFWIDFDGGTSAAEILRAHLDAIDETVASSPGEALADIVVSGITITDDEDYPNQVNVTDTLVHYDAANSLFTDTYLWEVTSDDCASLPVFDGNSSSTATFMLDSENFFPCLFNVALTVSNDMGANTQNHVIRATRIPTAIDFTVDMSVTSDVSDTGYISGDSEVIINVVDRIIAQGDGDIQVSLSGSNVNLVNDNDGAVRYSLSNSLEGVSEFFSYTILDIDSSESNTATITLTVPEIKPSLVNQTPTASSVVMGWAVPTDFVADVYLVMQKEEADNDYPSEPAASYNGAVFTHQANGLKPNTRYNFKVVTELGFDSNESNEITVSTVSGVPSGLVLSGRTSSRISISWTAGSGGTPSCYNVYRGGFKVGNCVSIAGAFQDTGLNANQGYSYTVSAVFGSDESVQSAALVVTTLASAPTAFSIANATTSLAMSWSDSLNAGAPVYRIYRNNIWVSTVSTLSSNIGVNSNTEYDFKVCTYISSDNAEYCTATTALRSIATTTDIQNYNISGLDNCAGCHVLSNNDLEVKARASACFGVNPTATIVRGCYLSVMAVSISAPTSEIIYNWLLDIK
ncbi:MAG: hypothetical protein ACI84K_000283 [Pseudohongiellaceae bacterium]|jgi:hypothetical protein